MTGIEKHQYKTRRPGYQPSTGRPSLQMGNRASASRGSSPNSQEIPDRLSTTGSS